MENEDTNPVVETGATEAGATEQTAVVTEAQSEAAKPARDASGRFAPKAAGATEKAEATDAGNQTSEADATTTSATDEDPEPDGDDIEAYRAWMGRERNRLLIANHSAALDAPTETQPTTRADDTAAASPSGPLSERFAALETSLQSAREGHTWADGSVGYEPTPGETQVIQFVKEALLPELDKTRAELDSLHSMMMVERSRAVVGEAGKAAETFKQVYGAAIDPVAIIGMAQNGGALAWATLNNVPPDQVISYLNADTLLQIVEAKLGPQLRKARVAAPATKAEEKGTLPDVRRGGGGAQSDDGPMTDDDIIDRALAAARAGKGAR